MHKHNENFSNLYRERDKCDIIASVLGQFIVVVNIVKWYVLQIRNAIWLTMNCTTVYHIYNNVRINFYDLLNFLFYSDQELKHLMKFKIKKNL